MPWGRIYFLCVFRSDNPCGLWILKGVCAVTLMMVTPTAFTYKQTSIHCVTKLYPPYVRVSHCVPFPHSASIHAWLTIYWIHLNSPAIRLNSTPAQRLCDIHKSTHVSVLTTSISRCMHSACNETTQLPISNGSKTINIFTNACIQEKRQQKDEATTYIFMEWVKLSRRKSNKRVTEKSLEDDCILVPLGILYSLGFNASNDDVIWRLDAWQKRYMQIVDEREIER